MVGVAKYNPVMCDMEDMPPIVYSRIFNTIGLVVKLIEDVVKLTKL